MWILKCEDVWVGDEWPDMEIPPHHTKQITTTDDGGNLVLGVRVYYSVREAE